MQHGDGEGPSDEGYGKILHSGIMPENWDNIQPAEYALEEGVDALMDDPDRRRRRQLMMMGGCGLLAFGAGSFLVGTMFGGGREARAKEAGPKEEEFKVRDDLTEDDRQLVALARAAARGDIGDLVDYWSSYVWTVRVYGGDLELWRGIQRLVDYALMTKGADARVLAQKLRDLLIRRRHPRFLAGSLPRLRARARHR